MVGHNSSFVKTRQTATQPSSGGILHPQESYLPTAPHPSKPMPRSLQEMAGRWCHRSVCQVLTIDVHGRFNFCVFVQLLIQRFIMPSYHFVSWRTFTAKLLLEQSQDPRFTELTDSRLNFLCDSLSTPSSSFNFKWDY